MNGKNSTRRKGKGYQLLPTSVGDAMSRYID